jgi:hypothetical protein
MGSELDDWIYCHFFTITVDYNSSESMTFYDSIRSLPNFSSTVTTHERRILAHTLNDLELRLADESLLNDCCLGLSLSSVMTDGQSASLSWNKAPM